MAKPKHITPKDPTLQAPPAAEPVEAVKRETLRAKSDQHLKEHVRPVEWSRETLRVFSDVNLKEHVLPVQW